MAFAPCVPLMRAPSRPRPHVGRSPAVRAVAWNPHHHRPRARRVPALPPARVRTPPPIVKAAPAAERWQVALAAAAVHTLHSATIYFGPSVLVSPMRVDLGLTVTEAVLPLNIFRVVSCALLVPAGAAIDRLGPFRVLWPGVLAGAIFALMLPFSSALSHLVVLQALFAISTLAAGAGSMQVAVMSTFAGARDAGSAQAITLAGWSAAGALAPAIIGAIAVRVGWRMAFAALGAVLVVVGLPLAYLFLRKPLVPPQRVVPPPRNVPVHRRPQAAEPLITPKFAALLGISAVMSISLHIVLDHLLVFLREDAGFSFAASTRFLSVLNLVGLLAKLIVGPLSDRMGHAGLLATFSTVAMVASLGFAHAVSVGAVTHLTTFLFTCFYGLGYSGVYVLLFCLLPAFGLKSAGFRANLILMAQFGFGVVGSYAASWLRAVTGGYASAFFLGAYCWTAVFPFIAAYASHRRPVFGPARCSEAYMANTQTLAAKIAS